MGNILLGVNLEFVRHEDKPFEWLFEGIIPGKVDVIILRNGSNTK